MITLRCTTQLRRRLKVPDTESQSPSGALGDWYAKIATTRPRHLVLCTNERSLLSVVVPLAPQNQIRERFVEAARRRVDQIAAAPDLRVSEIAAFVEVQIGRATNRSILSSMTQFGFAIESWFDSGGSDDLEALGLWLCDTPCFPLKTHWPWLEAELVLAGSVAPGRRPFKFTENVV